MGGTFDIDLVNGYDPQPGDEIAFLSFGATPLTGAIDQRVDFAIDAAREFDLDVNSGSAVTLSVVAPVADNQTPQLVGQTPASGETTDRSQTVTLSFDERMDVGTLNANTVQLSGPNGIVPPKAVTQSDLGREFTFEYDLLEVGAHNVTLKAADIKDLAGNPLGATDQVSSFDVVATTATWTNAGGGFWDDPNNWQNGKLPSPADDVVIDVAGNNEIVHRSGNSKIVSLVSSSSIRITGGTLDVATTAEINHDLFIDGGRLNNATVLPSSGGQVVTFTENDGVLDGVTLDRDATLSEGAQVTVVNDLIVNGTVTLIRTNGNGSATLDTGLNFSGGQQTLGGTGEVVLHNTVRSDEGEQWVRVRPTSGGQLTIGPDMTIRNTGRFGTVGSGSYPLDVQGTIISDRSDGVLRVTGSEVTNNGSLQVEQGTLDVNGLRGDVGTVSLTAGSHLDLSGIYTVDQSISVDAATLTLQGTWQNDATITLAGGSTFNVYGTRDNQGTISATDSTVNLHNNIVLSDLGTFTRAGTSTVNLRGTLQNQGLTLTQDANTNWRLDGGRINGGTIDSADGTPFVILDTDGVLDGVVLNANTTLNEGAK